jgi:hypothetical protein
METTLVIPNPFVLLERMVGSNVDPASLREMMELCRTYRAEIAKAEFEKAMNACQREMPTVVRDKTNTEIGKRYATVEQVQSDTKPIYGPHGFNLFFTTSPHPEPDIVDVHLDISHVSGHTKRATLANVALDTKGPKGGATKTGIQGLMSSISYAQGRLIRMVFNIIVADEDRDGVSEGLSQQQLMEAEKALKVLENAYFAASRPEAAWTKYRKWIFEWAKIETLPELPSKKYEMFISEIARSTKEALAASR